MIETLKEFVIHIVVGAIAFFVVAATAILLSIFVEVLKENGINPVVIKALEGFEYLVLGMDLLLASIFLGTSMYKLVKKLWNS